MGEVNLSFLVHPMIVKVASRILEVSPTILTLLQLVLFYLYTQNKISECNKCLADGYLTHSGYDLLAQPRIAPHSGLLKLQIKACPRLLALIVFNS